MTELSGAGTAATGGIAAGLTAKKVVVIGTCLTVMVVVSVVVVVIVSTVATNAACQAMIQEQQEAAGHPYTGPGDDGGGDGEPGPGDDGSYPHPVDRVVGISVDGLNVKTLRRLGPRGAPNMWRLLNQGASTLNARTMVEKTLTLPNHTSMVTGRPIAVKNGGHGVTWNRDRAGGPTVQEAAGHPVGSVFSRTPGSAVFASKTKFDIFNASWPAAITRNRIYDQQDARVTAAAVRDLGATSRPFTFVHLGQVDEAGHHHGWNSRRYTAAVRKADRLVGRLVTASQERAGRTSIILTADHGGRGPGHSDPTVVDNYQVPFAVWGPGIRSVDLYDINPDYADPGVRQPRYRGRQPVRNGDLANVAVRLLGRKPVPGSRFGARESLDLIAAPDRPRRVKIATVGLDPTRGPGAVGKTMRKIGKTRPDFITVNQVPQAATKLEGYTIWRPTAPALAQERWGNAVGWSSRWTATGRGHQTLSPPNPSGTVQAAWVQARYRPGGRLGERVTILSVHSTLDPTQGTASEAYERGMRRLAALVDRLEDNGPVLVTGGWGADLSGHLVNGTGPAWSPVTVLGESHLTSTAQTLGEYPTGGWSTTIAGTTPDAVFYAPTQATPTRHATVTVPSDHRGVTATFTLSAGADREHAHEESSPASETAPASSTGLLRSTGTAPAGDHDDHGEETVTPEPIPETTDSDLVAALMKVRFRSDYPTLTAEQARNAIVIGRVTQQLQIPRRGLVVAVMTVIQESKMINLPGGDRDSGGLFQQRPSTGWGSRQQVTNPVLATRAFYGRAQHTSNRGLLDIPGWESMPPGDAAQAVQISGYPDAYDQWQPAAEEIAALLGSGSLPETVAVDQECLESADGLGSFTVGSFNILGAGHTPKRGYGGWQQRLPRAMELMSTRGVSVAGLQEVHPPQSKALATRYSSRWGMWPKSRQQNKVVWERSAWSMVDAELVQIPYFRGQMVGMPVVTLVSRSTGQKIKVMSIHNPVTSSRRGQNRPHRIEALRRQLDKMTQVKESGAAGFVVGDFNDGRDGQNGAHCTLTPTLTNAFGPGSQSPCRPPKADSAIDHIFGTNVQFASAGVDESPRKKGIADHPLVTATTVGSTQGCPPTGLEAEKGLTPDALLVLRSVHAQFGPHTYYGVGGRPNASDHPSGRAVDIMIDNYATPAGRAEGDRIAAWVKARAAELGVTYIIWNARIWSVARAAEGWRSYGHPNGTTSDTALHLDHVHVSVSGNAGTGTCGSSDPGKISYPVPAALAGSDQRNWGETGPYWDRYHTGTDFSVSCGTPVLAAHSGRVVVDTTQGWSGRWLVKVSRGPEQLTTWYAHMQQLSVRPGQMVRPGQQIGQVGQEGNSSGCHLHFELHPRNGSIYEDNTNPSPWLDKHVGRNL